LLEDCGYDSKNSDVVQAWFEIKLFKKRMWDHYFLYFQKVKHQIKSN